MTGSESRRPPTGPGDEAADDLIGSRVSHYRIESRLGRGGMGDVYRALDLRLERPVAIKFLSGHLRTDEEGQARFIREARAASALDHPNVGAVYEIDRTSEGQLFIVMAYHDGETLADALARGPLPMETAIEVGIQLAEGLAAAHALGIVHRDLKPANVILTGPGTAKIIDFGVAKIRAAKELTHTGQTLGTLGYMSPEQAAGQPVDSHSDLWSLGVMLYEMTTGRRPFTAPNPVAMIGAILGTDPEPPTALRPDLPSGVEDVILACLEKAPDRRISSAAAVAERLRESGEGAASAPHGRSSARQGEPRTRSRPGRVWAAVLAGLALVALTAVWFLDRGDPPVPSIDSLVVLPFEDHSGDPGREYFVAGLHEALIHSLSRIDALRVISRTSARRYEGTDRSIPQIAAELDVDAVIEGSVLPIGDTVRIAIQLVDGRTDDHIWSGEFDREVEDVLVLLSEVAELVAGRVEVALTPEDQELLRAATKVDPALYDLYLRGRYAYGRLSREGLDEAVSHFRRAIEEDSTFAMAWAGLSGTQVIRTYFGLLPAGEGLASARRAAERALALDRHLSIAHTAMGWVELYTWDFEAARHRFDEALGIDPNDVDALHGMGDYLTVMGQPDAGLVYAERARDNDPFSPVWGHTVAGHLHMLGRFEAAVAEANRVLERFPQSPVHAFRAAANWELGNREAALADFRRSLAGRSDLLAAMDAGYASGGAVGAVRGIADAAAARADDTGIGAFGVAVWYARAGESERTLEWLERAYEQRSPDLIYMGIRKEFRGLHDTPRFRRLLRELGLPAPGA